MLRILYFFQSDSTVSKRVKLPYVELQSRSYAKQVFEVYRTCLREEHRTVLNTTCFRQLISSQIMDGNSPLLTQLVLAWNQEGKYFRLGECRLSITVEDVALMLGLSTSGEAVMFKDTTDYPSWVRKHIKKGRADRTAIRKAVEHLVPSDRPEDILDTCRFMVLLLFTSLLFQRSNYSCPRSLSAYLEDLDELGSYHWAEAIHSFLLRSLHDAHLRLTGHFRQSGCVTYFNGAVVLLWAWFYDITTPVDWSAPGPRVCRWSNTSIHRSTTYVNQIGCLTYKKVSLMCRLNFFNDNYPFN